MNRHFEFRVWNTKLKKFVAQATLGEIKGANVNNGLFGVTFSTDETINETQNYQDCVIQEWTGLTDVSGQKIFEGDIVIWASQSNSQTEKAPVVFSPSCAAFVLDSSGRHLIDDKYGDYIPMSAHENYKISGNIFESCNTLKKNTTSASLI